MLLMNHPKYAFILKASIFIEQLNKKTQGLSLANEAEQEKITEITERIINELYKLAKNHFEEKYQFIGDHLDQLNDAIQKLNDVENKAGLEGVCTICAEELASSYCKICLKEIETIIEILESKEAFLSCKLKD